MPEGPALLYFSTLFKKKFLDSTFFTIRSYTDKPVIIPEDYIGKVKDINVKGKQLWFQVTGKNHDYYVHIHYGLTGWLEFCKPEKFIKFELVFKDKDGKESVLYMEDKRRLSKIEILNKEDHDKKINKLGIDIFSKEFTLKNFSDIIKSKKMILAALLLDQKYFSGIGNYLKNEAMYLSGLDVDIKSNKLTDENIKDLYNKILFVAYSKLYHSLKVNLVKYLDPNKISHKPEVLEIPYKFKIYEQSKTKTGEKVNKVKISGRNSFTTREVEESDNESTKSKKTKKNSKKKLVIKK